MLKAALQGCPVKTHSNCDDVNCFRPGSSNMMMENKVARSLSLTWHSLLQYLFLLKTPYLKCCVMKEKTRPVLRASISALRFTIR